jgi:hypothetical protein
VDNESYQPIIAKQHLIMTYGICIYNTTAMKAEPRHVSEMSNQLLFGEIYEIGEQSGAWTHIKSMHDQYTGWVLSAQIVPISDNFFRILSQKLCIVATSMHTTINYKNKRFVIPIGSSLPLYDPLSKQGELNDAVYTYKGKINVPKLATPLNIQMLQYAKKYLHTPYLWGGRSPFGIDCSGLTQVCAKLCNLQLNRDAYQQAEQGTAVAQLAQAQVGDLAFFSSTPQAERITHVGIIGNKNQIIHASGMVRIDTLDEQGIFNAQSQSYSHYLKIIKRIF